MSMSQKRSIARGAPDFGAKEGDILAIKQQVHRLTATSNAMVAELEALHKAKVLELVQELHYMVQVQAKIICDAGLISEEDYKNRCRQAQMADAGLHEKGPNSEIEEGDTMIMRFKLFDEALEQTEEEAKKNPEKCIDDKTNHDMAYVVGSKGLPCDDGMIGMQIGESRIFDVCFAEGFSRKEFVGKPLRMLVTCVGIKVKEKKQMES